MVERFVTETGCTVAVVDAGRDGDAVVVLRMEQEGDGRRAEVILTRAERRQLARSLAPELAHDMPAELFNEVTSLLMKYSELNLAALFAAERMREQYGKSTRRRLGLD